MKIIFEQYKVWFFFLLNFMDELTNLNKNGSIDGCCFSTDTNNYEYYFRDVNNVIEMAS